ncbi:hypothetical protein TWF281_006962 [Arthrobotrys megalospora]
MRQRYRFIIFLLHCFSITFTTLVHSAPTSKSTPTSTLQIESKTTNSEALSSAATLNTNPSLKSDALMNTIGSMGFYVTSTNTNAAAETPVEKPPPDTILKRPDDMEGFDPALKPKTQGYPYAEGLPSKAEETEPLKRARTGSAFFYSVGIVCPSVNHILESLDSNPENYARFQSWPQTRPDPAFEAVAARHYFTEMQWKNCPACSCNEETGDLIPSQRLDERRELCPDLDQAKRCQEWLGCYCNSYMRKSFSKFAVQLDYVDAVSKIPSWIKKQHPGWSVVGKNGFTLSWAIGGDSQPNAPSSYKKYLVPGTAEPYYLEGPNEDAEGSRMGGKYGDNRLSPLDVWPFMFGGGSEGIFKRESVDLEPEENGKDSS